MNLKNIWNAMRSGNYKRKRKDDFAQRLCIESLCIVIAGVSVMLLCNNIGLGRQVKQLEKDKCNLEQRCWEAEDNVSAIKEEVAGKDEIISVYAEKSKEKDKKIKELEDQITGLKKDIDNLKKKENGNKNTYVKENVVYSTNTGSKNYNTQGMGIDTSKKTYMDYRCISRSSKQGSIVYGEKAWTDGDGLRRWGDRYCVAMGSYFGGVGSTGIAILSNGKTISFILADSKANKHTDPTNRYTLASGCMMEFIVDTPVLNPKVKSSGNINNVLAVSGSIVSVKIGQ